VRKVVVSHPFDASGGDSDTRYEIFDLSESGTLSATGVEVNMGHTHSGVMAFTPDGKVGIIAQDMEAPPHDVASLGVLGFDANGNATVVQDHFTADFFPGQVVMDPSGQRAYVLDGNWRNNGGGVYSVRIGCDGTLVSEGMVFASKLASRMVWLPGEPLGALLAAHDAFDSPQDLDAHLLGWDKPAWIAGTDAFPDDNAIISALAVMPDGQYALIGDNSEFSGVDNRVGILHVSGNALSSLAPLTPINDPFAIVASPYDNAALVASGYDNALILLSYNPSNALAPFAKAAAISYQGADPQLPGDAAVIDRGSLKGLVLVTEVSGIRTLTFQANGTIVDHGLWPVSGGSESIVGMIGLQP